MLGTNEKFNRFIKEIESLSKEEMIQRRTKWKLNAITEMLEL